jgi:hypothetical protein
LAITSVERVREWARHHLYTWILIGVILDATVKVGLRDWNDVAPPHSVLKVAPVAVPEFEPSQVSKYSNQQYAALSFAMFDFVSLQKVFNQF